MTAKIKIALSTIAVLSTAVVTLWYPYKTAAIPQWTLQVIDVSGNPLAHVAVHEEWIDPLDEGKTLADSKGTDEKGEVSFPRRTLHNRILFGNFHKHPSAHVFVCWQDQFGDVFWDQQHPELPPKLVLRKSGCGYG